MIDKKTLRKKYKNIRDKIKLSVKLDAEEKISQSVFGFKEVENAKSVFIYLGFRSEVLTDKIIGEFMQRGIQIFVPKIYGEEMRAVKFVPPFITNGYGIVEPQTDETAKEIDVVITPMLAFDEGLYRLGYGKGYYDKYFQGQGKNAFKIGLAFEVQKAKTVLSLEHDVTLDAIITEKHIFRRDK